MNAFNSLKPKAGAKPSPKAATKPAQAAKQAEPVKRQSRAIGDFQVAFDELPKQRASASKYDALLARWPVGAAVRCTAKEAGSIDADLPCYRDKRTAATARLIAAAPEMLEALGRIEALYSNLRHGGPAPEDLQSLSDALEEACDIARDAIELAVNGAQP